MTNRNYFFLLMFLAKSFAIEPNDNPIKGFQNEKITTSGFIFLFY